MALHCTLLSTLLLLIAALDAATGGLLQGLNEDSIAVQSGISEKVGVFQQHATTFLVGYIIAFTKGWDM